MLSEFTILSDNLLLVGLLQGIRLLGFANDKLCELF